MNLIRNHITARIAALFLFSAIALQIHAEPAGITGAVMYISPDYGNIETDITLDKLDGIGLTRGDSFTVGFGTRTFEVYLGETFSDVPKGDWVGFFNSAGTLRVARNFDNAAETLGVAIGDVISVRP